MSRARAPGRRTGQTRRALLRWYRAHRRDLPWRRTRDPYAVWISETMLQQTRVDTVIPYYERFLARFPDVATLAAADEEEVFSHWAGLGYYSRARNLQRAARIVTNEFAGRLPRDVTSLRKLPGVGPYTAGALASIAFDAPAAIVDGNVVRVLTRLHDIRGDTSTRAVMDRIWEEAALLVEGPAPGDLNQALMELGATCCTPRAPSCTACPLERLCAARRAGDPETLPVKSRRRRTKAIEAVCARVVRGGRVLMLKRPRKGLMAGMWELAGGERLPGEAPADAVQRSLRERTGLRVKGLEACGEVQHVFTHRVLRLHVFRCKGVTGRLRLDGVPASRWARADELRRGGLALGAATRKALRRLESQT